MYHGKTVCVVIPAHNESTQILRVLTTLPAWVDHIVVVDDASTDTTADVVVDHGRQRRCVPREPLSEEEVAGHAVDLADGGMAKLVRRVIPIESRPLLPGTQCDLDAAVGDAVAGLIAEQGRFGFQRLTRPHLERPEPHELRHQRVRQEHVAGAAALGDLLAQPESGARLAVGGEHVPHVQADDFRQSQSGSKGEREDQVVAGVAR